MFYIQQEERRRSDPRSQQCTIKLMEHLVQESKSIETMFGQFLKLSIGSDMQKRKSQEELQNLFIQNE